MFTKGIHRIVWAALALTATASGAPTSTSGEYALTSPITGPEMINGWDYAFIDPNTRRLFLATTLLSGAGSMTTLDLDSGHTGSMSFDIKVPHGIAVLDNGVLAVTDAGKNAVLFVDEKTSQVIASVSTGASPKADGWHNPDSILRESKTGLLIAVNADSGTLALIDVKQHAAAGSITIGGRLESAAAKGDGTLYVNVEDKGMLAIVDVPSRKVIRQFKLKGCEEPTGLKYDAADDLVISVCGNGVAKFIAADSGAEVASIKVAKGADAVMYDDKRKTVFIAGGDDGKLSILHVTDRQHIALTQTLNTAIGVRLGAVDLTTGKLYLPTSKPDLKAPLMHLPGLPPIPPSAKGSFQFLVVAPR